MSIEVAPESVTQVAPQKSKTGCILLGLGGGCLIAILACGGFGALGVFGLFTAIKSSDPYTESLDRATSNAEVMAELGQPIEASFMVQGNINIENDSGKADLNYSISGPNGSGHVHVRGNKAGHAWDYEKMDVTIGQGKVIDLLE